MCCISSVSGISVHKSNYYWRVSLSGWFPWFDSLLQSVIRLLDGNLYAVEISWSVIFKSSFSTNCVMVLFMFLSSFTGMPSKIRFCLRVYCSMSSNLSLLSTWFFSRATAKPFTFLTSQFCCLVLLVKSWRSLFISSYLSNANSWLFFISTILAFNISISFFNGVVALIAASSIICSSCILLKSITGLPILPFFLLLL